MPSKKKKSQSSAPPPEEEEYVVEEILDERPSQKKGESEYLVKWENYDASESTWEPLSNLEKCTDVLARWQAKQKNKAKSVAKEDAVVQSRLSTESGKTSKAKKRRRTASNEIDQNPVESSSKKKAVNGDSPGSDLQNKIPNGSHQQNGDADSDDSSQSTREVQEIPRRSSSMRTQPRKKTPARKPVAEDSSEKSSSHLNDSQDTVSFRGSQGPRTPLISPRKITEEILEDVLYKKAPTPKKPQAIGTPSKLGTPSKQTSEVIPPPGRSSLTITSSDGGTVVHLLPKDGVGPRMKFVTRPDRSLKSPEASVSTTPAAAALPKEKDTPKTAVKKVRKSNVTKSTAVDGVNKTPNLPPTVPRAPKAKPPEKRYSANGIPLKDGFSQTAESLKELPGFKPIPDDLLPFRREIERLRSRAELAIKIRGIIPINSEPPENYLCLVEFNDNGKVSSEVFMKRVIKLVIPQLMIQFFEEHLDLPTTGAH